MNESEEESEGKNDIERNRPDLERDGMEWNLREGRGIMEMDKFSQNR